MKARFAAFFGVVAALAACSAPKYTRYRGVSGDYTVEVPTGWSVIADAQGIAYAETRFVGPFDGDFYLGAPSLSVRWYRNGAEHRLRDGTMEIYASAGDFIRQTLTQVYAGNPVLYGVGTREGGGRAIVKQPDDYVLKETGLPAKYFGVLSPTPAPAGLKWGVDKDADGKPVNIRSHDYAVVPMGQGFYVLTYPATLRGHDKAAGAFAVFINSFHPYTDGPGGPKIKVPGPR